jgi:DNA-binding GntR family transcriptional regulator
MDPGYKNQEAQVRRVAPITRRRLVDDAAQTLRDAILEGRFPSGSRLRQEDLADQLGISRTPIREALGRLQHEGLIDLLPSGGVRVAALDLDEAVDLYDLREMLDGLAARLAATRASEAMVTTLGKTLVQMKRCVDRRDGNHWFTPHVAFHEEILRAAGNRPLLRQASVVRLSIQRFHPLLLTTRDRLAQAYREHREIHEAIAAHDAEAAERLARAHIASAKDIVLKVMTEGGRRGAVQA